MATSHLGSDATIYNPPKGDKLNHPIVEPNFAVVMSILRHNTQNKLRISKRPWTILSDKSYFITPCFVQLIPVLHNARKSDPDRRSFVRVQGWNDSPLFSPSLKNVNHSKKRIFILIHILPAYYPFLPSSEIWLVVITIFTEEKNNISGDYLSCPWLIRTPISLASSLLNCLRENLKRRK